MSSGFFSNWENKKSKLLNSFDELLDDIESVQLKQKILWRQIYENSIEDRNNANLCFTDVFIYLKDDKDNHIQLGQTVAKYLERMEKANEQLIKLATLVQKALENEVKETVSSDDLLEEIKNKQLEKSRLDSEQDEEEDITH